MRDDFSVFINGQCRNLYQWRFGNFHFRLGRQIFLQLIQTFEKELIDAPQTNSVVMVDDRVFCFTSIAFDECSAISGWCENGWAIR